MNKPFQRAQTLAEVALQVTTEPLQLGDPRYVDLSGGQDTKDLRQLRQYLEDQDARDNRFATAAFSGHRGCGKSTELLRLEHELEPRFTAVHLYVDDTLVRDIDYTDLLLWLVDSLATKFQADGMPLDSRLVDDVANWFAAAVVEDVDSLKAEVTAESTIEGQAKAGLYVVSLRILARLKSMVKGSIERRQTIRRQLQRYSTDLIGRVNLLLDDAARVLEKHGKEPDLLIVQDNLDRVAPDAARRLFIDNGDLLTSLHAHFIYTAPVALVLSPSNIGQVFEHRFTMPMVKTARPDGKPFRPGVDALIKLVDARVEIDDLVRVAKRGALSGADVRRQRPRSDASARWRSVARPRRRQEPDRHGERP